MAYTIVPTVETGELWTAARHNTYLRDNFAAGLPDIFTAKGDLAVGSGADGVVILPVGSNGKSLQPKIGETSGLYWGYGHVPVGAIAIWSGSQASIPSGWQLCNGTNGTPDLRDKFVVGAGSTYAVGATGGAATHTHTQPNTGNENIHTHAVSGNTTDYITSGLLTAGISTPKQVPAAVHKHSVSVTSDAGSAHAHSNPTTEAGSTLLPYYAFCFIQRLS